MERLALIVRDLRRAVSWHRRLLAAGLAAAAVVLALQALTPPEPAQVTVLAAATDLSAGEVPEPDDIRNLSVLAGTLPAGALRPGDPPDRALAGPVRAGEVLTDVRFVGPGLLDAYGPDAVAIAVQPGDPGVAGLLRPGDRVDVLAVDGGSPGDSHGVGAERVAMAAPVIGLPVAEPDAATVSSPTVVIVADRHEAALIAARQARSPLSLVLLPAVDVDVP